MSESRKPGHRLITQNLLMSAAVFERNRQITEASLQDLSTLIDLFCLYDRGIVLGRASWYAFRELKTELASLLEQHSFVNIEYPYEETIAQVARKHLASFLGTEDVERYQGILRYALTPSEIAHGMEYRPDGVEEIQLGKEWLYTASSRVNLLRQLGREERVARGTTFLVRTFLYLAYADVAKLTFTPDAVRCPVLEGVLREENEFLRRSLMARLQASWEQYPDSGFLQLRRTVSPFAAIVFERSKNRSDIAHEMEKLRQELMPFRERVLALEEKALWGNRDEAIAAERNWKQALGEIDANFGQDPRLISIERAITWSESISEIADKPTSWKNWLASILDLPKNAIVRLVSQRPAIEIHHLRSELPSPDRLAKSVERLFGSIQQNSV